MEPPACYMMKQTCSFLCRRENSDIPLVVIGCVQEIEKRGKFKGLLEYWIPSVTHSQLCPASRSWCLGESKRRLEKSSLRPLISFGWALSNQVEPRSLMNNMKVVVRINTMIIKSQMLCSLIKFSKLIFQGKVWRSVWTICMLIFGLKGF